MSGPAQKLRGADTNKGRADWETPHWLFDQLHLEFRFDIDAAASEDNAKLPRFWTRRDDGLAQPWAGLRVFCNPPYGMQTGVWVEKAVREVKERGCPIAVLVVPANTETFWWHDWAMAFCHEIRFVRRRIHFLLNGRRVRKSRPVFSSAVLVLRREDREGPCLATSLFAPDPKTLHNGRRVAQLSLLDISLGQ